MNSSNNIEVKLNNIPEVLKQVDQWVVWSEIRKENKIKKLPVDPKTGIAASVSNPSTWSSFEVAVSACQDEKFNGIGFVFTKNDPYIGLDFDDCFIDKTLTPKVLQFINKLESYTEISPSGNGLHTIIKGKLPAGGHRHDKIEVYDNGRFFTVTGDRFPDTHQVIKECQPEIDSLLADHFPHRKQNIGNDSAIIDELFNKKNGAKLKSLWKGQYLMQGYGSQSEADLALCQILSYHFGGNLVTVDRLFRQSGLYRDKWNKVHSSTGKTYGELTLEKAQELKHTKPTLIKGKPNFNCSDLGNAERLSHHYGGQLKYCHPWSKWVVWDGIKWSEDNTGKINQFAKKTVRKIYNEAKQFQDDNKRQVVAKHAISSESNGRIKAMVSLARSELPVRPEKFDRNRFLLNCENGTIDLSTGELKSHDKQDFITKAVPVTYDSTSTCPQWEKFLNRIMDNNKELIRFLQRAIGYALTGDVSEQCFFILWGNGDNGKTTFLRAIGNILGDYSQHTPIDTLIIKKKGAASNDVARLKGSRFVTAAESEKGDRLAENLIKQLTGDDTISARFLYQETFEFEAEHKLFLATNHKPIIAGNDHAIWRRIKLIPFQVTITKEEKDKRLPEKLKAEYSGILNWAIKGCLEWQRYGLGTPPEVTKATEEYRNEMDLFRDFINDCCTEGPELSVPSKNLYMVYTKWCEDNGEYQFRQTSFRRKLREKGFVYKQLGKKRTRCWVGLNLIDGIGLG